MKIRIYYMAELERDTIEIAEHDVILHPNLLQYYETEVLIEEDDDYDPLAVHLDIRKHFDIILQLNKIDKKDFKGLDVSTIKCVYENRTTRGTVFTGRDINSKYEFVFYFPFKREDIKIVKVISTTNISFTEHVVGKLISEDLEKKTPEEWESLA